MQVALFEADQKSKELVNQNQVLESQVSDLMEQSRDNEKTNEKIMELVNSKTKEWEVKHSCTCVHVCI